MPSKLCLGTAQFGSKYGITNKFGKIKNSEINLIIKKALIEKIIFFDSANAYGDAEEIIGNKLIGEDIKIITKFKSDSKSSYNHDDILVMEKNLDRSLTKLKKNNLDTYMLHSSEDLKKDNKNLLINWIQSLKDRGLINRFGLSIYEEGDLDGISLDCLDVIQMPVSIYDQRLIKESFINKLINNNISIHIRSIFLQGLILQKVENWPDFLSKEFKQHHKNFENWTISNNMTLLEGALSFIKNLDFPELVLFGVTNLSELNSIIMHWNFRNKKISNSFKDFKWKVNEDIDPRKWINY